MKTENWGSTLNQPQLWFWAVTSWNLAHFQIYADWHSSFRVMLSDAIVQTFAFDGFSSTTDFILSRHDDPMINSRASAAFWHSPKDSVTQHRHHSETFTKSHELVGGGPAEDLPYCSLCRLAAASSIPNSVWWTGFVFFQWQDYGHAVLQRSPLKLECLTLIWLCRKRAGSGALASFLFCSLLCLSEIDGTVSLFHCGSGQTLWPCPETSCIVYLKGILCRLYRVIKKSIPLSHHLWPTTLEVSVSAETLALVLVLTDSVPCFICSKLESNPLWKCCFERQN